jgi:hypothetical protein
MKHLEHPLQDVDVVLDGFTARNNLSITHHLKLVGMAASNRMQALSKVRIGVRNVLIKPELRTRNSAL